MNEKEFGLKAAHKASFKNRESIEKSQTCACFYCGSVFSPSMIEEWTDGEQTAICPHCGIDSVLGDYSGYPMTEEFLNELHKFSFG